MRAVSYLLSAGLGRRHRRRNVHQNRRVYSHGTVWCSKGANDPRRHVCIGQTRRYTDQSYTTPCSVQASKAQRMLSTLHGGAWMHQCVVLGRAVLASIRLLVQAYELRGAGAVMHSHSLNAVMATLIDPTASEFTVTNLEMVKVSLLSIHLFADGLATWTTLPTHCF